MEIIAHRGVHDALVRENTMAAFERAVELGCPKIELDCCPTKDRKLVVTHSGWAIYEDKIIWIRDFALEELVNMGVVGNSTESCANSEKKMPTLELILRNFISLLAINVELKEKGSASIFSDLLNEILADSWWLSLFLKNITVSSFISGEVVAFKKLWPKIKTAILWDGLDFFSGFKMLSLSHTMSKFGVEGIHISRRVATRKVVSFFKKRGHIVRVYHVDDSRLLPALADFGVDGIFTDRAEFMSKEWLELGRKECLSQV